MTSNTITIIKIDYTRVNGELRILDIGDGISCGSEGFDDIDEVIRSKFFELSSHAHLMALLDGEIAQDALQCLQPISFSSNKNANRAVYPLSQDKRSLTQSLHALAYQGRIANTYSSTVLASEQHKLYLYLLQEGLSEQKRCIFWDASQDIETTLAELRAKNIPSANGFFIKVMDNSNGGARSNEVMYAKDFAALRAQLLAIKDNSNVQSDCSYAIEQTYTEMQKRLHTSNNRHSGSYAVTGRAFILLSQAPGQEIQAHVLSAKYMYPSKAYQGPNKGSIDQFLANINQGQGLSGLLNLTESENDALSNDLNSLRIRKLWQELMLPLTKVNEKLATMSIPIHQKFMRDLPKRPFMITKLLHDEASTPTGIDKYFLNMLILKNILDGIDQINSYNTLINLCKTYSWANTEQKSVIIGHVAVVSNVLALIKLHKQMDTMPSHINREEYIQYLEQKDAEKKFAELLKLSLSILMQMRGKTLKERINTSTTINTVSDAHKSDCKILGITKSFDYNTNDMTLALAQAAKLSDTITLRALLLSRSVDIATPLDNGNSPLYYGLRPFSQLDKDCELAHQTLHAAVQDKFNRWGANIYEHWCDDKTQLSRQQHLCNIYDIHFARQVIGYYQQGLFACDEELAGELDTLNSWLNNDSITWETLIDTQLRLYISAGNNKGYRHDNLNATLRNAVVQADFDTVKMLIITKFADAEDVSPSGATAYEHAANKLNNNRESHTLKQVRERVHTLIANAIEHKHAPTLCANMQNISIFSADTTSSSHHPPVR